MNIFIHTQGQNFYSTLLLYSFNILYPSLLTHHWIPGPRLLYILETSVFEDTRIPNNVVLVSMDVTSLYTPGDTKKRNTVEPQYNEPLYNEAERFFDYFTAIK